MARRPRSPDFLSPQRDDLYITRDLADSILEPVRDSLLSTIDRSNSVRSTLSEVEDRRFYHPAGQFKPVRSSRRFTVPTIPVGDRPRARSRARGFLFAPAAIEVMKFKAPRSVAICVRRKSRKEVMHAMGFAGGKTSKNRRRNSNSNIWCK